MRTILLISSLVILNACSSETTAPATDAATADVPAADVPAVDAPAADVPVGDAPTLDTPRVDVPATDAPATDVPATDVPATDVPATDVVSPRDGCAPLSIDGSAIGNDCARDTCPAGYQCLAFSGVVLQMRCGVPCMSDCDCPSAFACQPVTDKAGTRNLCVRR